ncbi:MAG: hypothetical protein IKJ84_04180 [Oscillospiraceae bacterium]|nr:hypothetical protein [Oscillospiraceae bacterium]
MSMGDSPSLFISFLFYWRFAPKKYKERYKKTCTYPAEMSGAQSGKTRSGGYGAVSLANESKPGITPGLLTCCTEAAPATPSPVFTVSLINHCQNFNKTYT